MYFFSLMCKRLAEDYIIRYFHMLERIYSVELISDEEP